MKKHLDDVLVLLGCALILVGTYQISPLATWFVAGGMCIIGGIVIGLSRGVAAGSSEGGENDRN